MKTKIILLISLLFTLLIASCSNKSTDKAKKIALEKQIDSMRTVFNFPAVAYGAIRNDSVVALNTLGYRDLESKELASSKDYFHIGSCTKSFTSFIAGKLVEKGLINWNSEFFKLFPELKAGSNIAYHNMTLEELLSHRARLISFKEDEEVFPIIAEYEKNIDENISVQQKRYFCIIEVLTKEPQNIDLPKSELYSNAGFMAAGLMLEKASNKTWEELIMAASNELGLEIHIGWPVDYEPNQPKGHINPKRWGLDIDKELVPISDQLRKYHFVNQFNLLTTPSGNISITINGFLEYARLHLEGLKGINNYLRAETYRKIFNSFSEYSMGWWIEGENENKSFAHRGSNGTFYSFISLRPSSNLGIVVMTNTHEEAGLTDIIKLLIVNFDN